jgi:hypothetical protein
MKVMNGLDLQSQRIQNMADPSSSSDAATKAYVDNTSAGLEWKVEVRATTTTNGTLATAYANGQTVDGYTLVTGDRILLKNQTTQTENGIYVVAASGAPARAADANSTANLNNATVFVVKGTVNTHTAWTQTTADPAIGTDNIVFVQFGAGQTYTADNGLTLVSNAFSVVANGTSIDVSSSGIRLSSSALGNGLTGGSGTVVSVNNGTGLTFSGSQLTTDHTVVPQLFATAIGDGTSTTITVTHNLGTRDVIVSVYDATTHNEVLADVQHDTTTTVKVTFASAPASNAYRCVVHG